MKAVLLAALCLLTASCNTVIDPDAPKISTGDGIGHSLAIAPARESLSGPAVVTTKGVLAYDRDLHACRVAADRTQRTMQSGDDPTAMTRTIGDKPLQGSVTVKYTSDDAATKRDMFVRQCLSKRGYFVQR